MQILFQRKSTEAQALGSRWDLCLCPRWEKSHVLFANKSKVGKAAFVNCQCRKWTIFYEKPHFTLEFWRLRWGWKFFGPKCQGTPYSITRRINRLAYHWQRYNYNVLITLKKFGLEWFSAMGLVVSQILTSKSPVSCQSVSRFLSQIWWMTSRYYWSIAVDRQLTEA